MHARAPHIGEPASRPPNKVNTAILGWSNRLRLLLIQAKNNQAPFGEGEKLTARSRLEDRRKSYPYHINQYFLNNNCDAMLN
jgi:hypothetical protein